MFLFPLILTISLALTANYLLQFSAGSPRELSLVFYLGFFTVQTNLLTLVWALGDWWGLSWAREPSIRTWLLVYLTVTALVFLTVLLPQQTYGHPGAWAVDLVLHPGVWLAVGWDYFRNPPRVRPRCLALVLVYPTFYTLLALGLGALGWFPYAFLNPHENPYFLLTVAGFGLVQLVLGWLIPRLALWTSGQGRAR